MLDEGKLDRLIDQAHGNLLTQLLAAAAEYDDLPENEAAFRFAMQALDETGDAIPLAMMAGMLAVRLHRTAQLSNLEPGPSPA